MTDSNGMVWLTGDGGTTWLPFNVRTNPKLVSLYFADQYHRLGGRRKRLDCPHGRRRLQLAATFGRRARRRQRFDVFTTKISACSVGSRGKIWLTNDGGKNWLPVFSDVEANLNALYFFERRARLDRRRQRHDSAHDQRRRELGQRHFRRDGRFARRLFRQRKNRLCRRRERRDFAFRFGGRVLGTNRIGNAHLARRRQIFRRKTRLRRRR